MGVVGVAGDSGDATAGGRAAFRSISLRILRAPPVASNSFCFLACSSACLRFHCSNLASLAAFCSSAVVAVGVEGFVVCRLI